MTVVSTIWVVGISLVALIALFFRQTILLRVTAVSLLFCTAVFYILALLGPFTRAAITIRYNEGKLSDEFSAGVYALAEIYRPLITLVLVPLFGLGLLALFGVKKKNV